MHLSVVFGGVLGSIGIAMIFIPELRLEATKDLPRGLLLSFAACIFFSIGSLICEINERNRLPLLPVVMTAMLYCAVATAMFALALGKWPSFEWSKPYVLSLLYLSLFGSLIATTSYVALINRIGAGRAAYVDMIYPVIALLIAAIFEGYRLTTVSLLGVIMVLIGNFIAMKNQNNTV